MHSGNMFKKYYLSRIFVVYIHIWARWKPNELITIIHHGIFARRLTRDDPPVARGPLLSHTHILIATLRHLLHRIPRAWRFLIAKSLTSKAPLVSQELIRKKPKSIKKYSTVVISTSHI